ncbi:oligosaccharide flippase family protein [Halobacteriovorax sp. CON-3]|uniref:oligosaccharide flippase family protein n=1 Tax=Halobacteriovorax sp. CON-3 TaxID=3157710 RepID=UPI0037226387
MSNLIILKSIIHNSLGKIFSFVSTFLFGVLLARLLSPSEFGVVAIVLAVINFLSVLGEFGIGAALISKRNWGKEELEKVLSLTLIIGSILLLILNILSPIFVSIFDNRIYFEIIPVLSLGLFFRVISVSFTSMIRKRLEFGSYNTILIISDIVSSLIAVLLSYNGFGVWSLVLKYLIFELLHFYLSYKKSELDIYILKFNSVVTIYNSLIDFSFFQLLTNILNSVSANIDTIIVGANLNSSILGEYDRAYRLLRYPSVNISTVINPVLQTALVKSDSCRLKRAFKLVILLSFIGGSGVFSILEMFKSDIILGLYGEKWNSVIPIFSVLLLGLIPQIISSLMPVFFQLTRTVKNLLKWNIVCVISNIIFVIIGSRYGVTGVAYGVVFGAYVSLFVLSLGAYSVVWNYSIYES